MAGDAAAATVILQAGLKMDRPRLFVQADIMVWQITSFSDTMLKH